jgi:hypothetical protein
MTTFSFSAILLPVVIPKMRPLGNVVNQTFLSEQNGSIIL